MDRCLSGCVRPSTELVVQVLPASQLGWPQELLRAFGLFQWLVVFPSSSPGCIEKCIVMSLYLVCCFALRNASSWPAVGPARFSCPAGPLVFCGPWLFWAGLFVSGASYIGSSRWLCRIKKCGDLRCFALKNTSGLPAGRPVSCILCTWKGCIGCCYCLVHFHRCLALKNAPGLLSVRTVVPH